jgi:hypothetical protein
MGNLAEKRQITHNGIKGATILDKEGQLSYEEMMKMLDEEGEGDVFPQDH